MQLIESSCILWAAVALFDCSHDSFDYLVRVCSMNTRARSTNSSSIKRQHLAVQQTII